MNLSAENFRKVLQYVFRASANGFIARCAIWWEAFIQNFPDLVQMQKALAHDRVKYIREINALSTQHAKPWISHSLYGSGVQMQYSTREFARLYCDY